VKADVLLGFQSEYSKDLTWHHLEAENVTYWNINHNNNKCSCRRKIVWCTILLLHPGTGAEYCHQFVCLSVCVWVCLSASISLVSLDRSLRNLLRRSPVAVAQCSLGGVAINYVVPVLWITSRLAIVGRMVMHGRLNL